MQKIHMQRADYAIVVGLFVLSHALYGLLGVQFDSSTVLPYMQFIDPPLLRERPAPVWRGSEARVHGATALRLRRAQPDGGRHVARADSAMVRAAALTAICRHGGE
jgi:hypothetical protein